jgi:hypothetical protein
VFQTTAILGRERGMSEQEMNRMKHVLPVMAIFGAIAVPALAQENGPVSTATVYACADISDDEDRLACYDNAVGRLKSAEAAGEVVSVTRQEVEDVQRDSFGFSMPSLPKLTMPKFGGGDDRELNELVASVERVTKSARGKVIVYLDNNQVWQQTDDKRVYISRRQSFEQAAVRKAAFGSFMMKLDDGVLFRAERIR